MNKANQKYQQKQIEKDNTLSWWLLLLGILCVSLLIGLQMFPFYSPALMGALSDTGVKAEIFTTLKWYALLTFTVLSLLWFGVRLLSQTVTPAQGYLPLLLGILFVLALLSLLLSDYKGIALYGNYDMRDGTLSWLCFLVLSFIAASCRFPQKCERPLLIVFSLMLFVNFLLGLFLFFGINLTQSPGFMKLLTLGKELSFSSSGQIYGTMSNPNYLSAWASALASFFMVYFLKTENRKAALGFLIPIFFGFSIILTSISSSGFATLAVSFVFLAILGLCTVPSKKTAALKLGVLVLLFGGMFGLYSLHTPALRQQVLSDTQKAVQTLASSLQTPIAYAQSDYPYPLTDTIVDPDLTLDEPVHTFGNNRGYIWQETLRLIQDRPVLGYGLGTLSYYFPYGTKDYFAHRENSNELVNKPHNFYLGIAFGCGIPALCILVALFGLFFWKEKPQLRPTSDSFSTLKTACWLCCISLMVQFLVNDMMLSTSILFWVLLGLCYSLPRTSEPSKNQ